MSRARIVVLLFIVSFLPRLAGAEQPAAAPPPSLPPGASTPRLLAPLSAGETLTLPALDERVPRPDAVLGYPLGERFTHWDRIIAYLEALDRASDRVRLWEYGTTYEGRPLKLLAISSEANLARLDEIRAAGLRLADPGSLGREQRERLLRDQPAVVWLAYGIHGNESSSAEAAMAVAYVLAAAQGDAARMLDELVVLVDPLSNPDGRERYLHAFEQRRGAAPNPRRASAEHWEPWPGGRYNHYALDLNRDWAWASQQETRHRLAAYRSWEPQVYVDFHEMGSESTYFFPPAAEPIHPLIDRRILGWLDTFGRGNAEAFDSQGWIYFKGESFDLFYPGYGDSYPSLRGAVGMTYEVAGGGRAGQALRLPDGSFLSLADRLARHVTTSLSTLRTAAAHRRRLVADFAASREPRPATAVRTWLWSGEQQEARALADLLALHGVEVRRLAADATLQARPQRGGEASERRFGAGTYAVSTAQPLGTLVAALMELSAPMSEGFLERQRQRLEQNQDTEFYDITAWSLPLAMNVETWTASGPVPAGGPVGEPASGVRGEGESGYLLPPQGLGLYRAAAALVEQGISFRIALAPLSVGRSRYPAGTLFIPRYRNGEDLADRLGHILAAAGVVADRLGASYEVAGISLGSNEMPAVRAPRIGLLSGEGTDATSFGHLWHLLDRQIGLPHDRLDLARLGQIDLGDFDVLVFPDGSGYGRQVSEETRTSLAAWVERGGVLVAIGGAVAWLQEHELTSIEKWAPPEDDPESEESEAEQGLAARPISTPGAALATRMPPSHPLTAGLAEPPAVLVEGTLVLLPTGDPRQDVLVASEESPVVSGFAWPEAEERLAGSLLVAQERRGDGSLVLFSQDPAFRLFWRGTMPIFLNALIFGPSTGVGGRD